MHTKFSISVAAGLLALVMGTTAADARWSDRARGDSATATERASNARVRMTLTCSAERDLEIELSGADAPRVAQSGILGPTPLEVNTRHGVSIFNVRFEPTEDDTVTAPSPGPDFLRAISDGSSITIRGLARERLARFGLSGINRVMRTLNSRCGAERVEAAPASPPS